MKFSLSVSTKLITALTIVLMSAVSPSKAQSRNTAVDIINEAHNYDISYTSGSTTNRQRALSLYSSALEAEPDDGQRLHILYRMAQLNGTNYRLDRGEKPDFHKAIELYKEIIDLYPPEEPLVHQAAILISSHYTSLGEFIKALEWSKKVFEFDTTNMAEQIYALKQETKAYELDPSESGSVRLTREERNNFKTQYRKLRNLKNNLAKIQRFQEIAVRQLAFCAGSIDPLIAHGELRSLTKEHYDGPIAEEATRLLAMNMDEMADLWAPPLDEMPVIAKASESTLLVSNIVPQKSTNVEKAEPVPPKQELIKHVKTQEAKNPFVYTILLPGLCIALILISGKVLMNKKHKTFLKGAQNEI